MDTVAVLKAMADETRMQMLMLLLKHDYCVGSLAQEVQLSESTVSQHLKVLREAGLLVGDKRGYFMHYRVNRAVIQELATKIAELANVKRGAFQQEPQESTIASCHNGRCSDEKRAFCHGKPAKEGGGPHGDGQNRKD